ncbi:YqfO family protein [Arthrobacter monumenti]
MTEMDCLVVYVPTDSVPAVMGALDAAGAGRIGNYSQCAFLFPGTGQFKPNDGAAPVIGDVGTLEQVAETRIETRYPRSRRDDVLAAMARAHPYEVPAFMTFPIGAPGKVFDDDGRPLSGTQPQGRDN